LANMFPIREGIFTKGTSDIRLVGNQCKSCGQIFFPKSIVCFTCFNKSFSEITLSRKGKLYSYTIGHMPASHFQPPYAVGFVDLPEGIRIFAPLKMIENKPFKVGMNMELVVEELWEEDQKRIIGYKFKPV
jgi:uncharacterized OB-fold protein